MLTLLTRVQGLETSDAHGTRIQGVTCQVTHASGSDAHGMNAQGVASQVSHVNGMEKRREFLEEKRAVLKSIRGM